MPELSIIVPTSNEEKYISKLLDSLNSQTCKDFEVIVVDGGSSDKTVQIAKRYGARVIIKTGVGEWGQRNEGTKLANGEIIINTGADIIFPHDLLEKTAVILRNGSKYIGFTCPNVPLNPPLWAKIEYFLYNVFRYAAAKFGIYSISTAFIACKKDAHDKIQFILNEMNADGLFGKELKKHGKIKFDYGCLVFTSSRRMWEFGFVRFNLHFLYVIENFFNIGSKLFGNYKREVLIRHEQTHHKN